MNYSLENSQISQPPYSPDSTPTPSSLTNQYEPRQERNLTEAQYLVIQDGKRELAKIKQDAGELEKLIQNYKASLDTINQNWENSKTTYNDILTLVSKEDKLLSIIDNIKWAIFIIGILLCLGLPIIASVVLYIFDDKQLLEYFRLFFGSIFAYIMLGNGLLGTIIACNLYKQIKSLKAQINTIKIAKDSEKETGYTVNQ